MNSICMHVQYTWTESNRLGYATVRLTEGPVVRDLVKTHCVVYRENKNAIGHGHDPSFYVSARLTGRPIVRDKEVLTEGVKCRWIDSIGHGRTRPVSPCVCSTDRKSDRERQNTPRKCTTVLAEGLKCWRIESIGHGRARPVCSGVYLTDQKSSSLKRESTMVNVTGRIVVRWNHNWQLLWP